VKDEMANETYQGESGLVLVQGPDAGPVEGLQQFDARRVEGVLARDDAEKVGVTLAREHGVRVGVRELMTHAAPFIKPKKKDYYPHTHTHTHKQRKKTKKNKKQQRPWPAK